MNLEAESSGSERKERTYKKRANYFRNNYTRGAFNRNQFQNYASASTHAGSMHINEDPELNNNPDEKSETSEASQNCSGFDVKKSNNFKGFSKQNNSRYQSNSYRQTSSRNFSRGNNRGFNHRSYSRDQDFTEQSSSNDIPNASQRGEIVGNRYIRKQPHSANPRNQYSNYSQETSSANSRSYKYASHNSYPDRLNEHLAKESPPKDDLLSESSAGHRPNESRKYPKDYTRNNFRDYEEPSYSRTNSYQPRSYNNRYEKKEQNWAQKSNVYPNKRDVHKFSYQTDNYVRKYPEKEENDIKNSNDCSSESDVSSSQSRTYRKNFRTHTNYNASYESNSYGNHNFKQKFVTKTKEQDEDNATQRELLISRLTKGECECLVCCELIRTKDQIWHCLSCYHVFHLRCIKKWARSPAAADKDGSWRCPACQSLSSKVPYNYHCFCGKTKNPDVNYHFTPHSCGQICDRVRPDCLHPCKELCHPGPCPPCGVVVKKSCPCGKTNQTLPCKKSMDLSCQYVCEKVLNCDAHRCKSLCHTGECLPCEEEIDQKCYCGKNEQTVVCTKETVSRFTYSCGSVCGKALSCGHHTCASICHPGDCDPCKVSTEIIKYCCCGKSRIEELVAAGKAVERLSCTDPIPLCGLICGRKLVCGPTDNPHACQSSCHDGDCPPCPLATSVKCSCSAFTKEFPCAEISEGFIYKCEKRCNRRKDCSRHKCLNNCCTNFEHRCELVCNKKLSCGLHQCQETCHMGNCPQCWNVSFDELRCHCGESVLYPPIHCGTKPPECSQMCTRSHSCEHDVKHTCHSEETCPPCTSLTTKWCYGKHKQCGPVMCFHDGVSCGMPCQKPLPCGRHSCRLTCHAGECLKASEKCTQPCSAVRPSCGHPCAIPCHDGQCPETPCKAQVTSTCPCGHRSETATCFDSSKSYHLVSSTILATKMQEIKEGQSVNLSDVLGRKSKNNRLQCNEECAVIERNKRLAVALQIQNPDLSCSPGPPNYSEFLKDEAKKYPQFVADVYEKLCNLVQLAKESKQKCRSHSFPSMNRDQRRIVHELAEFFGCETQSYDEEPKKNVVATAYKNRCWLPFISIMAIVQRDKGIRKGPTPVLIQRDSKNNSATSSEPLASTQMKKIDYFDYNTEG